MRRAPFPRGSPRPFLVSTASSTTSTMSTSSTRRRSDRQVPGGRRGELFCRRDHPRGRPPTPAPDGKNPKLPLRRGARRAHRDRNQLLDSLAWEENGSLTEP